MNDRRRFAARGHHAALDFQGIAPSAIGCLLIVFGTSAGIALLAAIISAIRGTP